MSTFVCVLFEDVLLNELIKCRLRQNRRGLPYTMNFSLGAVLPNDRTKYSDSNYIIIFRMANLLKIIEATINNQKRVLKRKRLITMVGYPV